jgi:AcrR family transcriptional regulator
MRRDAKERRDTLVETAAHMFEEMGYDVPLEIIAEKAGVGRGTLYRNFKDRSALAIEVVNLRLDELSQDVARYPDAMDAFVFLLCRIGLMAVLHASGVDRLSSDGNLTAEYQKIQRRAHELFGHHLQRVQAAGRVRSDLTSSDLEVLARMLQAVATDLPNEERAYAISRAVALLIEGIGAGQAPHN